MASVTSRINAIKQPRGGYINPNMFSLQKLDDDEILLDLNSENLHHILVGIAVDYLSRALISGDAINAFRISIKGAERLDKYNEKTSELKNALNMAESIKLLSVESIISACRLAGYDVCLRAGPWSFTPVEDIKPNEETIKHIEIMVNRALRFFKKYPIVMSGFTFEYGGYTDTVDSGDGDFLSSDTLWDFKVSVSSKLKKEHTLQLLMYYLMGKRSKRSIHNKFKNITKLGVFNPRLNNIYTLDISSIPKEIIREVERDVIGYK